MQASDPAAPIARAVVRQIVLKIQSRCDLHCSYCYVFNAADQRWRTAPVTMSPDTLTQVAVRVGEHAASHRPPTLDLVLHGGEPLLAGAPVLRRTVTTVRSAVQAATGGATGLHPMLQTNGRRLSDPMLAVCDELGIGIGVSLDGAPAAHDRHRRSVTDRGSHTQVSAALARLTRPGNQHLFRGLLCVVDPESDPFETYEELISWQPPAIDFLLPHRTLPPGWSLPAIGTGQAPYGAWLTCVFDRWYDAPRPETSVRLFESLISTLFGGVSGVETVGGRPADAVVIETDGSITLSDTVAGQDPSVAETGLTVLDSGLQDAAARLLKITPAATDGTMLPAACRPCPVRTSCGGGLLAHRHRPGRGFDHRSMYCPDLYHLIRHIRARVEADLQALRKIG